MTEEKKMVAVLVTVMGAKAYGLMRNLLAPVKPADKKYTELIQVMKDHLNPEPLVIAERFKFRKRNQKEGERIAEYLAALQKLTETCGFQDFLDQALRDRLVCGLHNEAIQRKLLTEAKLTLKRAYEIAQGMETAQRQASELHASRTQEVRYVETPPTRTSCFRCDRVGHSQRSALSEPRNVGSAAGLGT